MVPKNCRSQQEEKGLIALYSANEFVVGCEEVSSTCHVALHNDLAAWPKELNALDLRVELCLSDTVVVKSPINGPQAAVVLAPFEGHVHGLALLAR